MIEVQLLRDELTKDGWPAWLLFVGYSRDELCVVYKNKKAKIPAEFMGLPIKKIYQSGRELDEEKEKLNI